MINVQLSLIIESLIIVSRITDTVTFFANGGYHGMGDEKPFGAGD
jgi:hypothetical protein